MKGRNPMALVAGIDGCPSGRLCLVKDITKGEVVARILPNISELLNLTPRPDAVMVDVPIGLPNAGSRSIARNRKPGEWSGRPW